VQVLCRLVVNYHEMLAKDHALLNRIENVTTEEERLTLVAKSKVQKYTATLLPIRTVGVQVPHWCIFLKIQCCGSGMFIPDPIFFHPGSELSLSRIRIKEFKYFNPKKWFLSSRKYDPGCPSRIQGSKRQRIPDPDPQH
jgi:hypothetical protein